MLSVTIENAKKKETKTNKQTSDQRANVVAKFEYRNDFPMI